MKDMFAEYVPEWGWLCLAAAEGNRPLIGNRAEENRYKTVLYKKAESEMVSISDYVCRNGSVLVIIQGSDAVGARRVINGANASFAKYKKLAGESVTFANWKPEPLPSLERYMETLIKNFRRFYVAELPVSGYNEKENRG